MTPRAMNYLTRDMSAIRRGSPLRDRQAQQVRDAKVREQLRALTRQLEHKLREIEQLQAPMHPYQPGCAYGRGMVVTYVGARWQASENTRLPPGVPGSGWTRLAGRGEGRTGAMPWNRMKAA